MAQCKGRDGNTTCLSTLYMCKKCGNVGCDKPSNGRCSNQGFKFSVCVRCGTVGQKELI